MNMHDSIDKLAKEHRLSRVIESLSVGRDGKATVVVTIYQKSSEGENTTRLEKYWCFKQIADTSENCQKLVEKAKSWATLRFLHLPEPAKEEQEKEKEEGKPSEKAKEEKAKEESRPAKPKKEDEKGEKIAKRFEEIDGDEEPSAGFVANSEPVASIPDSPPVTQKKKKVAKKKVAKKKASSGSKGNIKYNGRDDTHAALMKAMCVDKLGEHYVQFRPGIVDFIREVHGKIDFLDKDKQVLESFKDLLMARIDALLTK